MTAPGRSGRLLRDAVLVALVAVLCFQGLRQFVADRYLVRSGSMQPTFYGDPQCGDVVLVDKLAAAGDLQRYDLAVFRSRDEPGRPLVKRVVAFGDELAHRWIDLRDGDLWLGENAQLLVRQQKEPLAARSMRVPWFAWPLRGGEELEQFLTLPAVALAAGRLRLPPCDSAADVRARCRLGARGVFGGDDSGFLRTARAVDVSYIDARGRRGREGGNLLVDDVGLELHLEGDVPVDELFCGLDLRPDSWLFHWQRAGGRAELWRNGETVAEAQMPVAAAPKRIEYGFLDGRWFLILDGRAETQWVVDRRPERVVPDPAPFAAAPRNQLHFGLRAAAPVAIGSLQVFHDVHWQRGPVLVNAPEPELVAAGTVYLLGDNAVDSRDSRMFHGVPLTEFVGRPRLILGPWPRWQWLDR